MNLIIPNWPAPAHIKAYTTNRHIWGNQLQNKKELTRLLDLPNDPFWLKQVHGDMILPVNEVKDQQADASYTNKINEVCIILTADCLPILITDHAGSHVCAIHAGWRGLAKGIIAHSLQTLSLPPEKLYVWLGPAIGPNQFEVGADVYDSFPANIHHAFVPLDKKKWLANLYLIARQQLNELGVDQIYGGKFCTYSQENLFFSYRRDGKNTGRMASVIWRES